MATTGESDEVRAATFVDEDLRGARFVRTDLSDAVMRGVDVDGADIDAPWLLDGGSLRVYGVDVVTFVEADLNRRFRVVYGADVVAKTEGVLTFRALAKQRYRWNYGSLQNLIKYRGMMLNPSRRYTRTLTYYRMPMALLGEFTLLVSPLAWTYAVYWSLVTQTPALILGAYATITAYTLLTVWMYENLTARERVRLSMYAPTAYFLFYIMDLVQLTAALRCIARSRGLFRRPKINTWKSPQRAGGAVVVARAA